MNLFVLTLFIHFIYFINLIYLIYLFNLFILLINLFYLFIYLFITLYLFQKWDQMIQQWVKYNVLLWNLHVLCYPIVTKSLTNSTPTLSLSLSLAHTQGYQDDLEKAILRAVKTSMKRARAELKPNIDYLFTDVYDKLPLRLEQQKKQLLEHINKYKQHYPLDKHES